MLVSVVSAHRLNDFNDSRLTPARWNALVKSGESDVVFLTWAWQRAWWDSFGRGQLLLIAGERYGETVALAPLFADGGMVFFVGSGGSDYLDFMGDTKDIGILEAMLEAARDQVSGFVGFRFYHVPDASRTAARLQEVALRLGLSCVDEGELVAPSLECAGAAERLIAAANKNSLVRHERFFRRAGDLKVAHMRQAEAIRSQLEPFFAQHIARWATTPYPSLFQDPLQRAFYYRLTETAEGEGYLRFTRIDFNGAPIAFHFGVCYRGQFLWYKPSFDTAWSRRSPGEVLLRQLLLAAHQEQVLRFDFGLGDEAFKQRFATQMRCVHTWGLYPVS